MPVKVLLTREVPGDPAFEPVQSAAGIYIVSSPEKKTAQFPDLDSFILRQIYYQMIDSRSHNLSLIDMARSNAIKEKTYG